MEFNKIIRGNNRSANDEGTIFEILDSGFLCHIAFQYEGQTMMIPTAYGRKDDYIFIHGSNKNFMLNQLVNGQTSCICVTHLDGVVLARSLFDTSANYRSAILFGKAEIIEDNEERIEALKIITENIIKGRWNEVPIGDENEIKATMLVKFRIERASAKIRKGGPEGDDRRTNEVWSGHIPLEIKCQNPIQDTKFGIESEMSESVKAFWDKYK